MEVEGDAPPADLRDAPPLLDWRIPIKTYIVDGEEPDDKWEARRLKTRAVHYKIIDDGLYRWSSSDGAGENHSGGRALALETDLERWPDLLL